MSLTNFIKMADVKAKLKPLRPGPPRKIPAALAVQPRSKRFMLVGTAFDYLLRFELQRRAPHAAATSWAAESAANFWQINDKGRVSGLCLWRDEKGVISSQANPENSDEAVTQEVAGQVRSVIERAKTAHAAYLKNTSPARPERADLAAHAIRLARLDEVVRSRQFASMLEEPAAEDVEDLIAMLAIVPFDALLHDKALLLNPIFGQTSLLVGGADADLIVGEMLMDFKTTKSDEIAVVDLDQLLGYFLLARRQRQADPTFPAINRLALYFCRHGYLWTWDTTTWTGHPQFAETEEWFFNRAEEVFKAQTAAQTVETRGSWLGVQMDPADMKLTIGELIRRGTLRVQAPPPS
jgi:hypothetical protein